MTADNYNNAKDALDSCDPAQFTTMTEVLTFANGYALLALVDAVRDGLHATNAHLDGIGDTLGKIMGGLNR